MSYIVQPEQKDAWEAWANENSGWVEHDLDMLEADPDWTQPVNKVYRKPEHIMGFAGPKTEPGPFSLGHYLPSWQ